jgi:hypothetical protein
MTTQKLFKRRVRERMAKTGESYTAARRQLAPRRDRFEAARTDLSSATELASDEKLTEVTGRSWPAWLSVLDRWGARDRKHGETVEFLMSDLGVPSWYAQTITTGYERVRGLRLKHQQPDGFTIYVSKTVGVPIRVLFDAFADERMRRQWLTDGSMSLRSSRSDLVAARFAWGDGPTRVSVTFGSKGPAKATASVAHERLTDPVAADAAKAAWKTRLAALKGFLETTDD